ncbi:MAG: TRZ/ATZ family hydrolase [Gammaproteobacteria bacterium]|nr:TRZ/ATZ family hydrolase [Gammaproteobacteria bacterium]
MTVSQDQLIEADLIISAPWIVPVIPSGTVLEEHALAIRDRRISAIAPRSDIAARYHQARSVRLDHHVLIPGLVNAHGHSAMALMRGIADDIPLKQWLEGRIWPLESQHVSPEFVCDGALLAVAEMITGGTTCFADMYFFPEQVAKVCLGAGMRVQLACPILDFATAWSRNADECISKTVELYKEYRDSELVSVAFGPHAPYTVSDEPLTDIANLANELKVPVHIHMHETAQEIEDALANEGRRPLQRMADLGLLGPRLVNVHATQLTELEMQLLAEHGSNVVHCPSSNLKLASGLCEVEALRNTGVNVALGTDGAASNNDLDMFGELQLAAMLGKAVANDAQAVPAFYALEMATINSARAMGLAEDIGSLETGKFADIAAVNLDRLSTVPINNVISQLAYAVQSHQVTHLWCGGDTLLNDGELETLDLQYIKQRAHHWQQAFRQTQE